MELTAFIILFVSSEIIECVGYVSFILEIIRFSDSVSAFVRRSILVDFLDREDRFPKQANWISPTSLARSNANWRNPDLLFNYL